MATAGSIIVDLLARTGSFITDMDRAARHLKGVAKEAESTGKEIDLVARRLNSLVTAAGATVVAFAGTSAAMAMQVAKSMDATAKMAEQIGTTTESLTGLRFAAQQFADVSDKTFDMAMRRMTRRIEEAAAGSGGAKNALDALGLSARQLSQLSPDQQFLALADAIQSTDSQAQRLRHTMAIFDTEGMPLVAALQRGSAEMEKGIETARRYGLVLSTDAAQAAREFTDNMDALQYASQGLKQQIAEALLPSLVSVAEKLVEISQSVGPIGSKIETALKVAGVAAGGLAVILAGRLTASVVSSAAAFTAATLEASRYQMTLARMAGVSATAATAIGGLAAVTRAGSLLLGVLGGPVGLAVTAGLAATAFLTFSRNTSDAKQALEEMQQPLDSIVAKFKELNTDARAAKQVKYIEAQALAVEDLDKSYRELITSVQSVNLLRFGILPSTLNELVARLDEARAAGESLSPILREFAEHHGIPESALNRWLTLSGNVQNANEKLTLAEKVLAALDSAARAAASGVGVLNDAMGKTNEAGAKYLERLTSQAITAGLKTQREQLEALVKAGELRYSPEELEKARKLADHIDRMNAAYKGASSAAKEFESSVKSLIAAHLPEVKATEDLHKSLATLQAAQRAGIVVGQNYTKALESINLAYAKQVNDLLPESIKKAQDQVKAAREQQKQLEQQLRTFGMAESAVLALAAADTDSAIAKLEAAKANEIANGATTERIKHIEAEIQVLRELRDLQLGSAGLQGQLEWREQQRQQWESWARDVEQIFNQVGQSLTDALFEGGKSGRDLIKDLFKTLTLRVFIQPMMGQLQGWVTNSLGGLFGVQNPQQGGGILGTAQNLYSGYNAITGGLNSTLGNAAQWMGQKIGSEALTSFGLGLSGTTAATGIASIGAGLGASLGTTIGTSAASMATTTFSASLGGAAAGGSAAAGGAAGLGAAFGAALPWIGGALAVGSMFGLFGDDTPKTRHGQRARVDFAGDTFDITSIDDRQPGAESSVQQLVKQAVQSANAVFQQAGIDAAIDTFYAMTESSVLGDRQGVASGGMLRIGDALRQIGIRDSSDMTFAGFGGWSEADMLPRLATDIQLSILEAFQSAGVMSDLLDGVHIRGLGEEAAAQLATTIQTIVAEVAAFQDAIVSLPFANLQGLAFDAARGLIAAAGGLENLDAGMTSYFENFYSEEEKLEWATKQIGDAFGELGLTMPDVYQGADAAKRQFRELVESLDLNTESGQQAYATLMTLSGGFAELVTGMESLNASVGVVTNGVNALSAAAQAAQRAMQMVTSGGALADRIGGMLGLDPVFAMRREQELWDTIGSASYEQQLEMAGELTDIVLNRINKEQQANQERLAGLKQEMTTLSRMRDLGASLQNYVRSLESSDLAPYSLKEKVGIAEGELANLVSAARRGDENAMRQVQGALQNALKLWRDYGASGQEYQDAYHRLTGMVGNLANAAVSDAARQIAQLEAQSAALESMSGISAESLAQLQQLYDITTAATEAAYSQYQSELANANSELAQLESIGLDTARLHEIADLLKGMPALIGAQLAGASAAREQQYYQDKLAQLQATGSTAGGIDWMGASTSDLAAYFESVGLTPGQHYQLYGKYEGLSYGGDTRDQRYYEAKLAQLQAANSMDGGIDWRGATIFDLAAFFRSLGLTPEEHWRRYGQYEGLSYDVGTSYVPHDMTANIHKGEIIIDPRSSDILRRYGIGVQSSGGDAAEMRALRQGVDRLTQVVEQMGQAQVTATHQAAERSADKITSGVTQAVTRRDRDDLNARNMKRVGVLA